MAIRSLPAILCLCIICGCVHASQQQNCSFDSNTQWALYDGCSDTCCSASTTGIYSVPSNGYTSAGCCSDANQACPMNMKCCAVNSLSSPSTSQPRQCYNPSTHSCCTAQEIVGSDINNNPVYEYFTTVYDTLTQKCCAGRGTAVPVTIRHLDGFSGVVNIGDSCGTVIEITDVGSDNEAESNKFKRARCISDSDCPLSTTCCLRPLTPSEYNNVSRYSAGSDPTGSQLGECIDNTLGCCGGGSGVQYSSILEDSSQPIGNYSYMNYQSYDLTYQMCCEMDMEVRMSHKDQGGCSCTQDSHCPTGAHCCLGTDTASTIEQYVTCSTNCGKPGTSSFGCAGQCTMLSVNKYDGAAERCLTCGAYSVPTADPYIKCCMYDDGEIVPYESSTQFCCPLGVNSAGGYVGTYSTSTSTNQFCNCNADSDCLSGQKCCWNGQDTYGVCYDASTSGCCASGTGGAQVYDTNEKVCCPVSGVQSHPHDCGCNTDAQCPGGHTCCVDNFAFASLSFTSSDCASTGNNCQGSCINSQYETCCDNPYLQGTGFGSGRSYMSCNSKYQHCCDGDCCTKGLERCKKGHQMSSGAAASAAYQMWQHLDQTQKFCTSIEHPTVATDFYAWGFPAVLSLVSLLIIMAGAQRAIKAAPYGDSFKIFLTLGLSLLSSILGILLLWSITWKYAMFTVVTNFAILFSLHEPGRWQKIFVNILAVCCILYLIDPFSDNSWLTFRSTITGSSSSFSGLQELTMTQATPNVRTSSTQQLTSSNAYYLCTNFYQYFNRDFTLYDEARHSHKRDVYLTDPTHGVCRFDWVHAISVFSGILIAIQAFVILIGLLTINSGTGEAKIAQLPITDTKAMEQIVQPQKAEVL